MIHALTVLAAAGGDPAAGGHGPVGVVIVGFAFVLLVLALLATVTAAMGAWFTKQAADSAARAASAAQATAEALAKNPASGAGQVGAAAGSASGPDVNSDPALMAVVAAAVHTVFGDRPHRVLSIRSSGPGWAQEGRRQIFSSHRVR